MKNKGFGIYVHIPFCMQKCRYCDFNSYSGMDEKMNAYVQSALKEIKKTAYEKRILKRKVKSVYFGGGTPSYMPAEYIDKIIKELKEYFNISCYAEISIEINPGTINNDKALIYKQADINRISMGLQSHDNELLRKMGRIHTVEEFDKGYKILRKNRFENINIDLMLGYPGQTVQSFKNTINYINSIKPEHISCYSLKVEKNTLLYNDIKNKSTAGPDDEADRKMYYYAVEKLSKGSGYKHYEISNFAEPNHECRHNLLYWNLGEYIGIGAGAHSYLNNYRYSNVVSIDEYIEKTENNILPVCEKSLIDEKEQEKEFFILGLRLVKGISIKKYEEKFKKDFYKNYQIRIDNLIEKDLIEIKNQNLLLTKKGLDFANEVFGAFI